MKSRFRVGLREDLRDRMITVEVPKDWTLERLQDRVRDVEENMFRAKLGRGGYRPPQRGDVGEPMEDVRTRLHETRMRSDDSRRAARWVSREVLQQRREERLCLRCGKKGHIARDCNLSRATRPAQLHATSARTTGGEQDSESEELGSEN